MQPKLQQLVKEKIKLPKNLNVKFLNVSVNLSKPKEQLISSLYKSKIHDEFSKEEIKNHADPSNAKRIIIMNLVNHINNEKLKEGYHVHVKKGNKSNIELELMNHRIEVEEKFTKSQMNKKYCFPRKGQILGKILSEKNEEKEANEVNICKIYYRFNSPSKFE